jgi:Ni/Fe-hydrogenase 1 B-type cytochrome subunit
MKTEPHTHRVLQGPLEPLYVYEAPVRIAHWLFVLSITALAVTGYLIGSPPPAVGGEASDSFLFGWIRTIHIAAGWILGVSFAYRVVWAFFGNSHSRSIFLPPLFRMAWWRGMFSQIAYYLFLKRESDLWVGHNPLAQLAMFSMFVLGTLFMLVTGFALYAQAWGWGETPMNLFGWVFVIFGDPQQVRTLHHLCMWYVLLFALIHVYMVFREDIMSGESVVGSMVSGIRMFKREPRR